MFGYTVPLYSKMMPNDLAIYQRYYCETCHQLKSEFGLTSTSAVNYDMTFNTLVLDALSKESTYLKGTPRSPFCVLKDPESKSDLMRNMAAYTILLTKWELVDDAVDLPSIKSNFINLVLGRAISKAERKYPEYDDAIGKGFEELRKMEISNCKDAVFMGEKFGRSLSISLGNIADENDSSELRDLFSHLTSIIYVMDAVDDLDQDYLDDTYNPFLSKEEDYLNKKDYIEKNIYSITDTMSSAISSLQSSYCLVKDRMKANTGVTDNIVYHGIPDSARKILLGSSTAKLSVKNMLKGRAERNSSR
jgi:hypothetical protein